MSIVLLLFLHPSKLSPQKPEVPTASPTAWSLIGHKAGDNAQIRALAQSLGVTNREIPMRYSTWELPTTLSARPSLLGLSTKTRRCLVCPWPDLVLTAGRRNEAAALWIAKSSRGDTKLVHLGRPWHHPRHFDLILTTPQYMVPAAENVITLDLPLGANSCEASKTSAFDHLPRPRLALLIGGHSGALTLHDALAKALIEKAGELAHTLSGSLLISTSARTPPSTIRRLEGIKTPSHVWLWGAPNNPYQDYLASADGFIVTSDSASMFSDALSTSKPVLIFDLVDPKWWRHLASFRPNALLHRLAMRVTPRRMRRDLRRIHERMVSAYHAEWFGDEVTQLPNTTPFENRDLDNARRAVHTLLRSKP